MVVTTGCDEFVLHCENLSAKPEIYKNDYGDRIYSQGMPLSIVIGYYGFGKTYGIGYYVACRAAQDDRGFFYINIRELHNVLGDMKFTPIFYLKDIISNLIKLYQINNNVSKANSSQPVVTTNVIEYYPHDLFKKLYEEFENVDVENVDDDTILSHLHRFINKIKNRKGESIMYLILDELERGVEALDHTVDNLCSAARKATDRKINLRIVLLIQEALLKDKNFCRETPGKGIATSLTLTGYNSDFYKQLLHCKYKLDYTDKVTKIAKILEKLPPRVIFYALSSISSAEDRNKVVDQLLGIIEKYVEKLIVKSPSTEEFKVIEVGFREVFNELNLQFRPVKRMDHTKVIKYQINVSQKEKVICLDMRTKRSSASDAKVSDCDVLIYGDDITTRINEMTVSLPFNYLRATLYYKGIKNSRPRNPLTVFEGMGDMYERLIRDFREELRKFLMESGK